MAQRRRSPQIQDRGGYRLVVGAPVPPQAEAMTLGRFILVRRRSVSNDRLIAHELVHVRQFVELGAARFLSRYIGAYLRGRLNGYRHMAAYRRIPLEVEASWVSRVHGRSDLEPGAAAGPPVSKVQAPRAPIVQRLRDEVSGQLIR